MFVSIIISMGSTAITLTHLFDDKLLMNKNPYENDASYSLTVTDTLSFSLSRICFQTDGWFVSFVMFLCMFAFIHSWKCRHTCKHPLYFDCSAASAAAATTSHFSMTIWMKESRQSKKTTTTNSYNSLEVAHKLSECCLCHCHRWWWWLV